MATTTQIICKLTDTTTSTVVYESDVTGQVNGIIIPKGKVEADKVYKIELFQNTPENASDFKLQLSGTFNTTAWKIEHPTTIPWSAITGAPDTSVFLNRTEAKNFASKEDLKNKVELSTFDELKEEVEKLKTGGSGGGAGGGATGGSVDTNKVKEIIKDVTYTKELLDKKFQEVGGLAGGDQYATLTKIRKWLAPAGITIPLTKEEYDAMGWKGHSKINILFKLYQGGSYGPGLRGLVIELEKLGKVYVKYATKASDSAGNDKYNVILSTQGYDERTSGLPTPIPSGTVADGMTTFDCIAHGVGTYQNSWYYLPFNPLMARSKIDGDSTWYYFMGTTATTTLSYTITCPDRVKKITAIGGVSDRWSNFAELSVAYDATKVLEPEKRRFDSPSSELVWIINNPE